MSYTVCPTCRKYIFAGDNHECPKPHDCIKDGHKWKVCITFTTCTECHIARENPPWLMPSEDEFGLLTPEDDV